MNNVVTASRMEKLLRCPRSHFWRYEAGLGKTGQVSVALRFGSAWARAMEARWKGASYEAALSTAIPEGIDLNEYDCSILAALLAGYYDHYGKKEKAGKIHPEVQFVSCLECGHVGGGCECVEPFTSQGKIDGLGSMKTGHSVIIESKTTGDSIDPDSDYWLRLRFNIQVLNYISESRKLGWEISRAYYDVVRKPAIRPKEICDLDADKLKIVVDKEGKRVLVEKGKNAGKPRQSGDEEKGWTVKKHVETPAEFCDRLWNDALARPEFYFVRKEIPVADDVVADLEREREELVALIKHYRSRERASVDLDGEIVRDSRAWPRRVSCDTCDFCEFKNFCLQNITPDLKNLPAGYELAPVNPELDRLTEENQQTESEAK